MSRILIADVAAAYLQTLNQIQCTEDWCLDCGRLGMLHDIRQAYNLLRGFENPIYGNLNRDEPLCFTARYSVLDSLASSKRGRELFEKTRVCALYPGIVNGRANIFTLKEEFRSETILEFSDGLKAQLAL